MEEFYYRCKQILEEILTSQGFTEGPEDPSGLGRSIRFTKDELQMVWLYDLREQMLLLKMEKEKKALEKGYFYTVEKLQSDFLPKLEEMLTAHGFTIPEQNKQLAMNDLASFQAKKTKKGLFSKLFGN
jgi:hypothetical protein